jgi:hypothetical protein
LLDGASGTAETCAGKISAAVIGKKVSIVEMVKIPADELGSGAKLV